MKYSTLRFKPYLELALFIVTAGALAYFAQTSRWVLFWTSLAVAGALSFVLNFLGSDVFRKSLVDLRAREFKLANTFETVGATGVYLMTIPEQQLERNRSTSNIITTGNRFSLLTITAASYIDPAVDRHWEALATRLEAGCTLRLLLSDPFSDDQKLRNARNGQGDGIDGKLNLRILLSLARKYPTVEIRFTDAAPYAAIFLSENAATYDPYHLGLVGPRLENRFVSIHYSAGVAESKLDHYGLLSSHFNFLWELSIDLDQFLTRYRLKIPARWGVQTSNAAASFLSARQQLPGVND